MSFALAFSAAEDVANTTYLWLYVLLGIITLLGTGGLFGLVRYVKRQGVRDAKLDELIDPKTGVMARFAALDKNLKPNGLNTNQVGDVVKRTENVVNDLSSKLDQHIGAERQARADLWRAVNGKQDKEAA